MLPLILGSAGLGALVGGVQGYQRSGGDLGRTLASAATGGLLGGATGGLGGLAGGAATRFAGQKLGLDTALGQSLLNKGVSEATLKAAPGFLGGATNIGTQLAAGGLLAPLAGSIGQLGTQAAGATTAGVRGMQPVPGMPNVAALPQGLQDQNRPMDLYDAYYGTGLTARTLEELAQDVQMKGLQKQFNTMYPQLSQAKKDEMQRQLAAAQIRQNITTAANMIERGQQTAQSIGINAANTLGNALASQYQYQ
jgi:hypothetical protein